MFQAIGVLRGERQVPDEIRPLCFMDCEYGPVPRAADFADVDVFLIEFGSTVDMMFRGCYLNRLPLSSIVLQPLRDIGKDAAKYANQWLRSELMAQDPGKRLELAEQLIAMMPDDLENAEFIRGVLRESSAEKIDVLPALEKLRTLLKRPVGLCELYFPLSSGWQGRELAGRHARRDSGRGEVTGNSRVRPRPSGQGLWRGSGPAAGTQPLQRCVQSDHR